jgi:hypothetical protein
VTVRRRLDRDRHAPKYVTYQFFQLKHKHFAVNTLIVPMSMSRDCNNGVWLK